MSALIPGLSGLLIGLWLGFGTYRWYHRNRNRRKALRRSDNLPDNLGNRYFRGINYLLNEQPDKALEVFLQLADVTPETVDTHLALGSLFRRRGEMDSAIRCHENIIDNEELSEQTRQDAMLELGEDYLRAGVLDRAEELFTRLVESKNLTSVALERLLEIFQQEQEWQHAIQVAKEHERISGRNNRRMIAHFYCQLAENCRLQNNLEQADQYLKKAHAVDADCARIYIIRAQMEAGNRNYGEVVQLYRRAIKADRDCFELVIDDLVQAYIELDRRDEAIRFLQQWLQEHSDTSAVVHLLSLSDQQRNDEVIDILRDQLLNKSTVGKMHALLNQWRDQKAPGGTLPAAELVTLLKPLLDGLYEQREGYQCRTCGLTGHTHHWQCPGCRNWDTTLPVRGILGE